MFFKLMKHLIVLLFVEFSMNLFGQTYPNYTDYSRKSYPDSLFKLVDLVINKHVPEDTLLYFCFPSDISEDHLLYLLEFREEEYFEGVRLQIDSLWIDKCYQKDERFMLKFIQFSDYVDGYYAEDYYDTINKIMNKTGMFFCNMLAKSDDIYIKRFLEFEEIKKKCPN